MFRRNWSLACTACVALLALQATAYGQLIVGQENELEPVYHVDIVTLAATPLFVPADSGVDFAGIEGLTVDDAGRTIYFTTGTSSVGTFVYSAHYDDPDPDFAGRLRVRRVAELAFAGEVPRVTGLAWDSIGNRLLTSYQFGLSAVPEGVYEVDLNTGAMTLLLDFDFESGDVELSGLDFNPIDGFLYANNLDFSFRFLNRIDLTQPAASARTDILSLALNSNEEGLAVSNGDCGPGNPGPCDNLAYLVPDDTADPIRVVDLTTDTFLPDLGLTPFTGSTSQSGAGWGPNALSPTPGPNFCLVTSAMPADGSDVQVGDSITYMIRNQNCGNETAVTGGTYTITLSGAGAVGATIDSVVSDSGLAMETVPDVEVSATVANVFAGFTENVTITVTTANEGELNVTATFNPVDDVDAYDPNNTESLSHNVRVFPLASALASTVSGKTSAAVPGSIEEYESGLGRPNRSPDGNRIAFEANTTGSTTTDDVLVRYDSGVGVLISQEATTPVDVAQDDLFNEKISVNNAGYVGYVADTTDFSDDEYIVIALDNVTRTAFAREDTVIPFSPFQENGWDYGSTLHSANINGNRDAIYCNEFMGGGISSSENTAVFRSDEFGNISALVAWEGNTIPGNQAGGGTLAWESFDDSDQWADGAGCQVLLYGDLTGSTDDNIVTVNGEIVFQEGQTIAGTGLIGTLPSPGSTTGVIFAEMLSNGDWLAHGTTSESTEDWVIKGNGSTYSVIALNGDEIIPGSGEFWSDTDGFSPTFRAVAGNNQGDVAIMGRTTESDTSKNLVIVINGTTEVLREGDPVALDSDGLFDDNAFIGLPNSDEMILTDGGELILTTQLLDNTGSDIGDAVVTVNVSAVVSPMQTGADLIAIKSASTDVVEALGDPITYTITVCNVGPEDATNVVINDTLPAETTFSEGSNGAMESMGVVTINLGTVEAFTSTSATITVTADANGTAVNNVSVSATEADPNPGNNTASTSTLIEARADVGVSKIDNGGAPVGMNYNYTVTVTNDGPSEATNVLVRDSLPVEVTFVTASLPFVQNGQDIDVTIPSIPAGGSVMYDITVTPTVQALVTNTISILSLDQVDLNPANDSFVLETINGDVADMAITKADEGLVTFGDDINYTIEIENLGPGPANNVVVTETLPAGVNLVAVSVPFNEVVPGVLELSFSTIAATTTESVTLTVTPNMTGAFTNMVDVTADEIDPDPANNTASVITRVGDFRQINVIYSEIDGHPTAIVPGALDLAGMPVVTEWKSIEELAVSPDGSTWVVSGQNELSSSENNSAVSGSGTVGTTFAQEGQQIPGEAVGTLYSFFDDDFGFNNNNDFAWGARATGTSSEDLLFTVINGVQTTAVRESDSALGLVDTTGVSGDETLGNSISTAHLLDDNSLGFYAANIQNIGSSEDTALFYSQFFSSTAFLQEGVSSFGGENVAAFVAEHFRTSPDGLNYIAEIGLGPDFLSDEEAVVVNDVVVLRQNTNFMGIDIDGIFDVRMIANGDWFVRGDDLLDDDYVVSNGSVIARTGDPITTGSLELWGDVMIAATGNANGDYIVIGNTSEPDTEFDTVMVLNGETVVAREGDPVDLDGNGMFDDNVFIGRGTSTNTAFSFDDVALTDDGLIYFISPIRDAEGNDLGTFGSGGEAFMTIDISDLLVAGCATIPGDIDGDGDADGADIQGAIDCILSMGAMGGQCDCLDYDMSGLSDLGDVNDFVADLLN